jgi:hypothetical protein
MYPLPLESKNLIAHLCQEPWVDILFKNLPGPIDQFGKNYIFSDFFSIFTKEWCEIFIHFEMYDAYHDKLKGCEIDRIEYLNLAGINKKNPKKILSRTSLLLCENHSGINVKEHLPENFLTEPKICIRLLEADTMHCYEKIKDNTPYINSGVIPSKAGNHPYFWQDTVEEPYLVDCGVIFQNNFGKIMFFESNYEATIYVAFNEGIDDFLKFDFYSLMFQP